MRRFKIGERVEVSSKQQGFIGSYFEANIINLKDEDDNDACCYTVCYKELLNEEESGPLIESAHCSEVRPYPPRVEVEYFLVGEVVDAFANDGWWVGVLVEIRGGVGYVRFDEYDKVVIGYPMGNIRIHLDWDDGEWSVSPSFIDTQRIKQLHFHD